MLPSVNRHERSIALSGLGWCSTITAGATSDRRIIAHKPNPSPIITPSTAAPGDLDAPPSATGSSNMAPTAAPRMICAAITLGVRAKPCLIAWLTVGRVWSVNSDSIANVPITWTSATAISAGAEAW